MGRVRYYRKSTPKVKGGKALRKNRTQETPGIYNTEHDWPRVVREKPGRGYRHLILKQEMERFMEIIPDWEELSRGLNTIVLAAGEDGTLGWHTPGIIGICAWDRVLEWEDCDEAHYRDHEDLFAKLEIPCERDGDFWHVGFTEKTARAFQLIHVFIHELGHHHDRITTQRQVRAARGDAYAESYAAKHEDEILKQYIRNFDLY